MADAFDIPRRAMAIFAHPDDVDFGCSGTIGSWIASAGTDVTYCVITSGQKGTHDPKMSPTQMAKTREAEQRAAGEAIGVKEFVFLGHQDGELERTMELRGELCRVIREHKPEALEVMRTRFKLSDQAVMDNLFDRQVQVHHDAPAIRGHVTQ